MRINEIITESQELEEGWKSKLGAAALAGAAALGGGHQDAQAQNYSPPPAVMAKQNADFYQAAALHRLTKKEKSSIIEAAAFTRAVSAFALKRNDKEASDHFGKISKDLTKISSLITANYEKLISARTSQIQKTDIKELQSQWRDSMENLKTVQTLIKDTLQQDLEEGWKSKLGAAALAGAAMLGGGHQDAQAQNYQPTAQTQRSTTSATSQSPIPANLKKWVTTQDGTPNGRRVYTQSLMELAPALGEALAYSNAGVLNQEQSNIFQKYLNIYKQSKEILDPQFRKRLDDSYNQRYWMHEKGATSARRALDNMRTDADYKRFSTVRNNNIAHLLNLERKEKAENTPLPKNSTYGDIVVDQAKSLSAQDQKFYDGFNSDLNKVSQTLKQIRASKPTREKMEAARKDLARVIPQYDSTLNQAISRGFDKSAAQTLKLKIDDLKRIAGIPLNQK